MTLATAFNYFANSLWQVPLLAVGCWCALRLARASARLQYAAWVMTLLLCVALPWRGARPFAEAAIDTVGADAAWAGGLVHPLPARPLPFYALAIRPHTRDLLAELYLVLTALVLLRLAASLVRLSRLIRSSTPHVPSAAEQAMLAELNGTAVPIRVLAEPNRTPMLAGILRPVILLPASLFKADRSHLRAVLAHELAHLRRRDTLANLLLRLAALPIGYHPATMLVHRRIRHARELVCDSLAAGAMPSPNQYAHALLVLAQHLLRTGGDTPCSTVGLFERTSKPLLEERIMTLITPPAPLRFALRLSCLAAGLALFGAAAATVSLVHLAPVVLAAEQPANPGSAGAAVASSSAPATQAAVTTPNNPMPKRDETSDVQEDLRQATTDLDQASAELHDSQMQHDLREAIRAGIDTKGLRQQMDALRAELNSQAFKQQIAQAARESGSDRRQMEAMSKQLEAMSRQLNSSEFRKQIADITAQRVALQAETARILAETRPMRIAAITQPGSTAQTQEAGATRVSSAVMAGQIVSKVAPIYPPDAKAARISGAVVLHAIIGKDGTVAALDVVSGPRELQTSALDAVRQWVYKPYLLNGEPTEVETTVTVTYSFGS